MIDSEMGKTEKPDPDYFYIVRDRVYSFGQPLDDIEEFSHLVEFRENDLVKSKNDAIKYYQDRRNLYDNDNRYMSDEYTQYYIVGKYALFNISLSLISYYKDDFSEYSLIGVDDYTIAKSMEFEASLLKKMGLK